MDVVIVESPAKAKTINKYLGKNFQVLASYGHVRDLPSKDGSVEPEQNFAMTWEVDTASQKRLRDINTAVKKADTLYLATDPDREGEAISWHVLEVLRDKGTLKDKGVKRVVFNEITRNAVLDAMANPRELDTELVDAYLARRALDYLVGFTLSPVLWRKLPGARSAGRVQSVALRIVCERELEIESFIPREYWTVEADLKTPAGEAFKANLVALNGDKLEKFSLPNEEAALAAKAAVEAGSLSISTVERKPARRNPASPFTTSTLQQEAARKLGFSASRTMQVAQKLYEGMDIDGETVGLITYMRTDGVTIAQEAVATARDVIAADYGNDYLPDTPRSYSTKAKNAQEAHEAIRPTGMDRRPKDLSRILTDEQYKLYDLIWKRSVASQMESARFERTTATIANDNGQATLRATGSVLKFQGFLALYKEGIDEENGKGDDDKDRRLPEIKQGDNPSLVKVNPDQHFTEPPPRYTEASLVKRLEELGIGRPSTYASVLEVLRARNYVHMDRNRFIPEDKGRLVTAFLESFFERYVQYDFTANMEEQLDDISAGKAEWKSVLQAFWTEFSNAVGATKELRITEVLDALNEILGAHVFPVEEEGKDPRDCPTCDDGRLSLKVGKFGAFVGCSNYPECKFTRPLGTNGEAAPTAAGAEDKILGVDEGDNILLRSGRFGPYVQRGEGENKDKPPRSSIPKDVPLESVDLEKAVALLSLPREVGLHPETGKVITAAIGRYGPYLRHDGKSGSLTSTEEVFTIGINHAVDVLANAKNKQRRGPTVLKELGVHPDDEQPINVLDGRYGPYVKHNKTNATLPKDLAPEDVTLEQAIDLVNAKAAKPKKKRKAATKKKTTAKKKTTKKSTTA